ncbi:uncharacterized protein FMAN_09345 [Fusarium mangiferae]|uniref:Uncharacterized protein n=1 Tax=Fusarium mangiferae TaxID=192010 RepID=A0A1L7SZV2_FUSMA|nr:uncharacterized protein FMAN_09345 [Fusarium mangiferae]CVK91199.1 uncharacterized protein FMAN_09345 [Fusarium mangiferae]
MSDGGDHTKPKGGQPPTPSKRLSAEALENQGIQQGVEFESALPCLRCFNAALTLASNTIATLPGQPIDVPTFDCTFPCINSKKCTNCDKNLSNRMPTRA